MGRSDSSATGTDRRDSHKLDSNKIDSIKHDSSIPDPNRRAPEAAQGKRGAADEATAARVLGDASRRYGVSQKYVDLFVSLWRRFGGVSHFAPGDVILRAGEHPTHFHLLIRGLVRYYYTGPKGRVFNKTFIHEGQTAGPLSAWLNGAPSPFSVEALEPTEALALRLDHFAPLFRTIPAVERFVDGVAREAFLRNEEHEAVLLTSDAEARYRWLLEHQQWLVRRVPQYHLAAYLGLNAVTLSRVKRAMESAETARTTRSSDRSG